MIKIKISKVKELVKMVLPFCLLALLPLMTSCDEIQSPDIDDILSEDDEQEESAGDALQITDIHFSDDYKEMELSTRLLHDVGGQDLTDSTKVVYTVEQHVKRLINKLGKESQPVITKVSNSSRDLFNSLKIRLLVLVDLSLPQQQVDAQCKAVKEMRALFGEENLFIAFMQGDNVSETYQATDYIINNYFVHQDPSFIYLYRSVVTKLAEMQDKSTTIGNATRKVMIILSGGKTYNGELPVDPKHFELEELLNNRAQTVDGMMRVYYANFSSTTSSTDGGPEQLIALSENVTDNNVLQYFCKASDGLYQSSFSWQQMEEDILKDYNIDLSNYKITLEQPDRKVFRGDIHVLEVAFHDKATGDLIAKGQTEFSLGSVYSPVVVRDGPMIEFVMSGILFTLFLLLIVWLIFQFLEPYIRYRIFKKKYVITYTGSQMSYQGEPVSESCYLCKAPFKAGDEIVVKCKHTMHKECWDDNEYHCPEHGRHCKEGSHFYNQHELLDPRNALFYMKWVLVAIVAGFTAWCVFVTRDHPVSSEMIEYLKSVFDKSKVDNIFGSGSGLSDLPAFGQAVGFLLTFFLANFTVSHRQWYYRLCEILLRSFIASFVGCLLCLLGCLISVMLHFNYSTFLTEWIP